MIPPQLRRKVSNRLRRLADSPAVRRDLPAPVPEASGAPGAAGIELLGEHDYRALLHAEPEHLYLLGARMASSDAIDLLARQGTRGRFDWQALAAFVRDSGYSIFPGSWRLRQLLYAALLNIVVNPGEEALLLAARATRLAARHREIGPTLTEYRLWMMCQGSAILTRDTQLLEDLYRVHAPDSNIAWGGRCDLMRPDLATAWDRGFVDPWWRALNEPLTGLGLEPWQLDSDGPLGDESLFTRIHAPLVAGCAIPAEQQPLVSVIVPCYRPTRSFANTVESLTRQSWSNIEIIIFDDASPDGEQHLAAAESSDDRVRVIRLEQNGGAYIARNSGLREARGEFVTFLDADDLSHSRRIEYQVLPLLEDPALVATFSRSLRIGSDGEVTYFGTPPTRLNMSSLLFRRAEVLDAIGYYDEVRKAADSEFRERIEAWRGPQSVYLVPAPLSLVQLTAGSLSRGDFRVNTDWFAGVRIAYRDQYRGWHRRIAEHPQRELPLPAGERACLAPQPLRGGELPDHFDVAYLGDWQEGVADTASWVAAIRASDAGRTVGLLRGVHPRLSSRYRSVRVAQDVWELVESGDAAWISWEQRATVDTLIVTDLEYLVMLPVATAVGLRVKRVVVCVEHSLPTPAGRGTPSPSWLSERCERALGVRPEWLPGSRGIAHALVEGSGGTIQPSPATGCARFAPTPPSTTESGSGSESGSARDRVVVQVTPLRVDAPMDTVTEWVPPVSHAGVRLIDDDERVNPYERERLPPHVRVLDAGPGTPVELIERADILVFDPLDRRRDSLDALWSALARGLIVVAPRSYAPEFGDLIVAFDSAPELGRVLEGLGADPEAREAQRASVRETLSWSLGSR
ncbi:MAG: glycosyltransferase family 2 protein [Leucobacter sp.]